MHHLLLRGPLLIALLLFVSACAGLGRSSRSTEPAEEEPAPRVNLAQYEDFDVAAYRDVPPQQDREVQHDVPLALMESRADAGEIVTMQGYRIQIFSTIEQDEADQQRERFSEMWEQHQQQAEENQQQDTQLTSVFKQKPDVYLVYRQPYYRLRIGNFASRSAAQQALQVLKKIYPNAFIVPDTVTITR